MVEKFINGKLTSTKSFEDIFDFDSCFVDINGHKIHYIEKGKGKIVLMIHGNPTWSFYFRNLVQGLQNYYRCIAYDHIGCGLSDKPCTKNYNYTLQSRITDLDLFIKKLGAKEKISFVLHDWGGMIGLAWAIKNPDRVDKIVITNTSGFLLPSNKKLPFVLWLLKRFKFFSYLLILGLNLFARGALFFCSTKKISSKIKKGFLAPYNSWKNRIAILKFVHDIPIKKKDPAYEIVYDVSCNLQKLKKKPLLFLWGAKDFVFDLSFLALFKKRFNKAQYHILSNAGHYLFEDKPNETLDLVKKFLNK